MVKVHDIFRVSLLKKYIHDPTHVMEWSIIQTELEGQFPVYLDHILNRRELTLWN